MPRANKLEAYLDEYLQAAGIAGKQAAKGRSRTLTAHAMTRVDFWLRVRRRAEDAGITGRIGPTPSALPASRRTSKWHYRPRPEGRWSRQFQKRRALRSPRQ